MPEQAERRIMKAVESVGAKVDDLAKSTGEFQLVTAVAIAKIQQIEATCPVNEIEETLREVKATSDQNKRDMGRIAALIAGGVTFLGACIHMATDWFKGS